MQSKNNKKVFFKSHMFWILVILVSFISYTTNAQVSCTQTLVDAQDVFSSGQIELVPEILESCLQKGFNRQEKIAAYRLLTLCHLYYNRTSQASITMGKMLKINPEYKIQDIDPTEFINLHETFRTTPLLIIGIKGGIGKNHFYETTNYNDINSVGYGGKYSPKLTLLGGVSIEAPIIAELSIVVEAFYKTYNYEFSENLLEYANIDFKVNTTGIEVPLLVQWNILKNKNVIPYINAGASMFVVLNSSGVLSRKDTVSGGQNRDLPSPSVDLTPSRNPLDFAIVGGAGVRIKDVIGKGYITFDLRYSRYFNNSIEAGDRADSPPLTYSYMYTNNSFKIENIQFLIGYKVPVYLAKQRKSARAEQ